ncbi:hypothetical protein L1887_43395 [Cichorium endivia]|nr:hypothetical protein L1887_43395 [Cichorium endivia]
MIIDNSGHLAWTTGLAPQPAQPRQQVRLRHPRYDDNELRGVLNMSSLELRKAGGQSSEADDFDGKGL